MGKRDEHHAVCRRERLRLDGGDDVRDKVVRAVALQLDDTARRRVRSEKREVVLELRDRLALVGGSDPRAKRAHAHVLEVVPRRGGDGEVRAGAGRATCRRVVDDHWHAVRRAIYVALDALDAALERKAERRHRVLGAVVRLAAVRHDARHRNVGKQRRRRTTKHGHSHKRRGLQRS